MFILFLARGGAQQAPFPTAPPAGGMGHTSSTLIMSRPPVRYRLDPKHPYTARDLLAVGTLKRIDSGTSTAVVLIDRNLSDMPHILVYNAKKAGVYEELLNRVFPPEKEFYLTPLTMFMDARRDHYQPPTRASTGKIMQDKERIPLTDFKPGDHVSVWFKMNPDPARRDFVINLSKVDADRTDFSAEVRLVAPRRVERKVLFGDQKSSATKPTGKK
jgi:hypothetical protein